MLRAPSRFVPGFADHIRTQATEHCRKLPVQDEFALRALRAHVLLLG
jgi:hypothetical protein